MTINDPGSRDFNRTDRNRSGSWGWILAAVAALLVIGAIFWNSRGVTTASNNNRAVLNLRSANGHDARVANHINALWASAGLLHSDARRLLCDGAGCEEENSKRDERERSSREKFHT